MLLRSCILAILIFGFAGVISASDFAKTAPTGEEENDENKHLRRLEEEAAEYRLKRAVSQVVAADESAAKDVLADASRALAAGEWKKARSLTRRAFKKYRFTVSTSTAGDLKRINVIAAAKLGKILETREELTRLWLYFPDYPDVGTAMTTALEAAEKALNFTAIVHLDRERPSDVIDVDGASQLVENDKLFHFLSQYGDRKTVAPRAELGIARSALLTRSSTAIREPQDAYEHFLDQHPRHELSFTALTELALAHLVTYQGPKYDVGALTKAAAAIDVAETETRGNPERVALVQAYRARIRSWLQDRDLEVARWYRDRHRPTWLSWLKEPSDHDWDTAARFYYNEVIKRDPASAQARLAHREMASLPPPHEDELGGSR
jgi:hypothetical protein